MTGKSGDSTKVRFNVRAESKLMPWHLTDEQEEMT